MELTLIVRGFITNVNVIILSTIFTFKYTRFCHQWQPFNSIEIHNIYCQLNSPLINQFQAVSFMFLICLCNSSVYSVSIFVDPRCCAVFVLLIGNWHCFFCVFHRINKKQFLLLLIKYCILNICKWNISLWLH